MNDPLLYAIAFAHLYGINAYERCALINTYGSAIAIYKERQKTSTAFLELELLSREVIMAAWPLKAAAAEIETTIKLGIETTCLEDALYPNRLIQCKDAPSILYSKGSRKWNLPQLVSIVGTRSHTLYADKMIQELLEGIAHLNLGVVSGLALGIDGLVHEKACQLNIPNWGVMATGLDTIYPTQHHRLAARMMEQGGVISENATETPPLPFQFPKRNRIVAGLTDVTIVIESAVHGGSMITAGLARGYDREVFALPGKLTDLKSGGCLALIASHTAQLYHSPSQLLQSLSWSLNHKPTPVQNSLAIGLSITEEELLNTIRSKGPIHRDELANLLKINIGALSTHLLTLELNGLILPHGGAFYSIR